LPKPFFVIATQNPHHLIGTYPLPESQLDRFLVRIKMGYPGRSAERELLKGGDRRELLESMQAVIDSNKLLVLQQYVSHVHVSDALLDYVQNLLEATRHSKLFADGLSPRAGLALMHCARAWALLEGRSMVLPEDVQAVTPSVITHRLQPAADAADKQASTLVQRMLESIPIP
jgi:MoxR-like ATPase